MDLLILPGDDIGPEIMAVVTAVLRTVDDVFSLGLVLEEREVGVAAHARTGATVSGETLAAARAAGGIVLGPAGMTAYPEGEAGWLNVPGTIRKRLDLYANIRPARSRPGLPRARAGLDVVIVRENTEGFYADRNMFRGSGEFMPTEDVALSVRRITRPASARIARVAFAMAAAKGRPLTAIGKRHVLQVSDGLFFEEVRRAAAAHPGVTWREADVDAMASDLYTSPDRFGVLLVTNMFGDILSNLAVALSGSLGLAASLNAGDDRAAANAGHGSAPDIAGRGIANPLGLTLSAALLLDWLGLRHGAPALREAAAGIEAAVDAVLADPATRTRDLGGGASTEAVGAALRVRLRA